VKISYKKIPAVHAGAVVAFVALCAGVFGFLWVHAGGKIPLITQKGYRVTVTLPDADNLVFQSDVRMAGVRVGKIEGLKVAGRHAKATLQFNDEGVIPLHEGATVTVANKTLIEETYLDVKDGTGPALADGAKLAPGASSVQLNDVLTSLDQPTRDKLGSMLRSSGLATKGTKEEVDYLLTGLGGLGRNGNVALEAVADQSQDLAELTRNVSAVLRALDTQQGRIVQLATDSDAVTASTAAQRADIEELVRALPPFMDTTRDATDDLQRLAKPLNKVAKNLDDAAPDLSAALEELPATTRDLRGLVPYLDSVLDRAPATLKRTPKFVDATQPALTNLGVVLQDLNPMLQYLKPYGQDFIAQFTNVGLSVGAKDSDGHILRVRPIFTANSVNSPIKLKAPGMFYNPYPAPGASLEDPVDFTGNYPHLVRDTLPK
jgi:phospholipid/cholesterol/gamma-HCH transport system substrate-binding protein